jgi:hypothetical protein
VQVARVPGGVEEAGDAEKEEEDIARGRKLRHAYGQEEQSREHT